MKGAQIGGTECGNNWIGYIIHQAPGPMMAIQPTVEMAKRNSKQRIDPLIEESEVLRELVSDPRSRDSGNTVLSKEFPGGVLVMTGANSAVGLRSMAARYLFLDEVDGYPGDVEGEGDPVNLAMARTRTFARRKVFMCSTPKITGMSRIEAAYEESDQRLYWVPCPVCREFQMLKFAQLRWPKGETEKAVYVCEHCGQEIHNHQKQSMLARGEWRRSAVGDGKTAGFHLSSLYSPVGWFSWGDAAKQFEQAQKNSALLQVFVNTVLGETWTLLGEAPEWQKLYDRREDLQGRHRCRAAVCSLRRARTSRRTASRSRSPRGAVARNRGRSIIGCSKATPRAPAGLGETHRPAERILHHRIRPGVADPATRRGFRASPPSRCTSGRGGRAGACW